MVVGSGASIVFQKYLLIVIKALIFSSNGAWDMHIYKEVIR